MSDETRPLEAADDKTITSGATSGCHSKPLDRHAQSWLRGAADVGGFVALAFLVACSREPRERHVDVVHGLAKVRVASSNLVIRSGQGRLSGRPSSLRTSRCASVDVEVVRSIAPGAGERTRSPRELSWSFGGDPCDDHVTCG